MCLFELGAGASDKWVDPGEQWWRDLLGCLPAAITDVKVELVGFDVEGTVARVAALVQGGTSALRHPVTLTLLHRGVLSKEVVAELLSMSLAGPAGQGEGEAGGEGQRRQHQSFLTLRVVSTFLP